MSYLTKWKGNIRARVVKQKVFPNTTPTFIILHQGRLDVIISQRVLIATRLVVSATS